MSVLWVLVVTLLAVRGDLASGFGWADVEERTDRCPCSPRDRSGAVGSSPRGGDSVLRRARHLPHDLLRDPYPGPVRKGRPRHWSDGLSGFATPRHRSPTWRRTTRSLCAPRGVLRAGSRSDQRARQDGCPGHGAGAVDCVAGKDLPCRRRRAARAEEEATRGMATVRLPGSERLLAARRRRARPPRRTYKHERIGRRRRPVREATQQAECGVAPRNEAQRDLVARRW